MIAWGAHWAEGLMAQLAVSQHGLRTLFSARNARIREVHRAGSGWSLGRVTEGRG